jgi:aminoglycoside phosphotransferase (APT) family kinase protein
MTADPFLDHMQALASRIVPGAGLANLRRLSGGASQESWAFDAVSPRGPEPMVLRRATPNSVPHPMAAGFAVEVAAIEAAGAAGIACPHIRHRLTPEDGLGEGFATDHVAGETLARRIQRDASLAAARESLVADFGDILARIHAIPLAGLPAMRRAGIAEGLSGIRSSLDADPVPRPVFEWAHAWARQHAPSEPDRLTLIHGDFRLGNVIVGSDGIRAVLDWELCHIGDPAADLAWLCLPPWRFGARERPVAGLGTRAELFEAYAGRSGVAVDPERVRWWEVMGSLRWGLFCAEMLARFVGDDPSVERGMIVRRISESEIDLLIAIDGARGAG